MGAKVGVTCDEPVLCDPEIAKWSDLIADAPSGRLLGRSQRDWREATLNELDLPSDRAVIATGHQTLLWHPGILAKYIARDAAARAFGFAQANLVVDQHVGDFGEFETPVRTADGSLGVTRIRFTDVRTEVPMALHPAFVPYDRPSNVRYALESVEVGMQRIIEAVRSRTDAPNAAIQMSRALADLMKRWVSNAADITATALCATSLARAMMRKMIEKPQECVEAYNRAVATVPEAGIPPLAMQDESIELPLWWIGESGVRVRADVDEVARIIGANEGSDPPILMPRALFMTALVRLGMCDLFIHGTGGAAYDRAMEIWIREWLGANVAPRAVVTADLRLPLLDENDSNGNLEQLRHQARHLWHDPERDSQGTISAGKREMLDEIARLPRNSPERTAAFFHMHRQLEAMRREHHDSINEARNRIADAVRRMADRDVAARRDWAFPLYPEAMIDDMARAIRAQCVA